MSEHGINLPLNRVFDTLILRISGIAVTTGIIDEITKKVKIDLYGFGPCHGERYLLSDGVTNAAVNTSAYTGEGSVAYVLGSEESSSAGEFSQRPLSLRAFLTFP